MVYLIIGVDVELDLWGDVKLGQREPFFKQRSRRIGFPSIT